MKKWIIGGKLFNDWSDFMLFQEKVGDMFSLVQNNEVICITTNARWNSDGRAVMGVGTAKLARDRFKDIDLKLANYLKEYGNRCFSLGSYQYNGKIVRVASFPTKDYWGNDSDLDLIEKSANELVNMANKFKWSKIYLPMPGVGAGKLSWKEVSKRLSVLDDRFIVISLKKRDFNM